MSLKVGGECCAAHERSRAPLVLGLAEATRLRAAAARRHPPLRSPKPKEPAAPRRTLLLLEDESMSTPAASGKVEEDAGKRRRERHHQRALREAQAEALRARETIKQLDNALSAAQVLQELDAQIQHKELERKKQKETDAGFASQVRKIDEETLKRDAEKARMRESQKRELRHHLQMQNDHKRELEQEKKKGVTFQIYFDGEKRRENEKILDKKQEMMTQSVQLLNHIAKQREEEIEQDRKLAIANGLYRDFQHGVQEKLKNRHKERIHADGSKVVFDMIAKGLEEKECKLDTWLIKVGKDRIDRKSKLLCDAERQLRERKERAVQNAKELLELAEERRRRDKEAEAKEKAFDWRRQQLITKEWEKLQQEKRRQQQVAMRDAHYQKLLDEREEKEVELLVDSVEEAERRRRHKHEDAEVLAHARQALEQCALSGKPTRPLVRAVHSFKKRRGMLPPGAQRASVLTHLKVGLDWDRVAQQADHYIMHEY